MRGKIFFSVAFVVLSTMLCCMLGAKMKHTPISTMESFSTESPMESPKGSPQVSAKESSMAVSTQEPMYTPGQFVRMDGFLYIYEPGKQYFNKEKYDI